MMLRNRRIRLARKLRIGGGEEGGEEGGGEGEGVEGLEEEGEGGDEVFFWFGLMVCIGQGGMCVVKWAPWLDRGDLRLVWGGGASCHLWWPKANGYCGLVFWLPWKILIF